MLDTIVQRLREVTVRPTVGANERRRWDALMAAHHYLPFRGLVGRSMRHVAVLGEQWLALARERVQAQGWRWVVRVSSPKGGARHSLLPRAWG